MQTTELLIFDFVVTVNNSPPEEISANRVPDFPDLRPHQTRSINELSVHFTDPEGDPLAFSLLSDTSQSVTTVFLSGDSLSITTKPTATTQTNTIAVRARDGYGGTVNVDFEVTVNNSPPSVIRTIPAANLRPNQQTIINLDEYYSDSDGDPLTYTAISSDESVAAESISNDVLTVSAQHLDSTQSATISITARDGMGGATSTSFVMTVVESIAAADRLDSHSSTTSI